MIKAKIISATMSVVGTIMIVLAVVIQYNESETKTLISNETNDVNIANMASSNRKTVAVIKEETNEAEPAVEEVKVEEVSMDQAPQSEEEVYIPPRVEVYEGMTMEELIEKLNRNLGNGYIAGKGEIIASKCIELGVDPYVATAIMLHETGCKYSCSRLVLQCNNVGGQKGTPACSGSYKGYNTIDEGIIGHIENLYLRYYSKGLNTVETIGPKYAESGTWVSKINWYVNQIRAS